MFTARLGLWIERGLEALWLLAVVLVPLAFLDRDFARSEAVIGYVEVPKIALLRTLAGLMAMLWLLEWGLRGNHPAVAPFRLGGVLGQTRSWLSRLRPWLSGHPTHWLILAVWFFLWTTVLSTILSGSINVSLWGEVPGQDGYPFYTIVSYVVLFGVISTHLKTRAQLWRLMAAITAMGVLVAGYGIFQHYGNDFLGLTETTGGGAQRATSFMGNAIFSAATILMTIPVTLALALIFLPQAIPSPAAIRERFKRWTWITLALAGWAAVLAVQVLGLAFTFSRGPWVGALFAVVVFLGAVTMFVGWRAMGRSVVILGIAAVFALAFMQWQDTMSILGLGRWFGVIIAPAGAVVGTAVYLKWQVLGRLIIAVGLAAAALSIAVLVLFAFRGTGIPDSGAPDPARVESASDATQIAERFSSITSDISGGLLGGRTTHWRISWELIKDRPWPEFDSLSNNWLRPLIGYGPDLFRYTYLLRSPPEGRDLIPLEPDHAHNYFIHQTVEQGFLGLFSSLGIFIAIFWLSAHQLLRVRSGLSDTHKIVLIALLSILAGRFLEMMVGVARVSDLTVLWVILAMFVVLPIVMHSRETQPQGLHVPPPPGSGRPRRRGRNTGQTALPYQGRLFWRLAIVAILVGGIGVLIWVKNVNYIRASVGVAEALKQFRQGDLQSALSSMDKATDLAPDVSHYYNNRAGIYLVYLLNENLPPERGCSSREEITYRPCLAVQSFQSNLDGLAQRPLYFRYHLAAANSAYILPQLANETVQLYRESLSLVPESWPIRNALADAQIQAGQYQEALGVLEESLAITGDNSLSATALLLQATAYQALGDLQQSARSLERSLDLSPGGNTAQQAHRLLAEYQIDEGEFERAIEELDSAVSLTPDDAGLYFLRGQTHSELGRPLEALQDFATAARLDPDLPVDYPSLGFVNFQLGQSELAIQMLDRALQSDPDDAKTLAIRGVTYNELGQTQRALQDLDKAIRLEPNVARAYYFRGTIYHGQGKYERAIWDFDEAIRLNPRLPSYYGARGLAYTNLGEDARAISDFETAMQIGGRREVAQVDQVLKELEGTAGLDPLDVKAFEKRGLIYLGIGQHQQAIQDFDQAIARAPVNADAYVNRGIAYSGLGEYRRAIQDFDQGLDLAQSYLYTGAPQFFPYFFNRGLAHFNLGNFGEAIEDLSFAIGQFEHPDQAEAIIIRGISYGELGQKELALQNLAPNEPAIEDLNLGFRHNPQDANVYYTRGLAYLHLGQYLRSTVLFDQTIRLDPDDPLSYLGRGIAFSETGRYQQAEEDLDRAVGLAPRDPRAYFRRAQVSFNLDQYQRAIADLDQAIQLNPFYASAYVLRGEVYQAADQPLRAQADYAVAQRFNALVADKNRLREVILSGPQDAKDYNIRGLAYVGIGQHQLAIQDFDQYITLTPGDADGYINRGLAQSGLGAYQRAIQDFDQGIKLSRGYFYTGTAEFFPYFVNRGLGQFNLGNFAEAIDDLSFAIERFEHPDQAEAFIIRGISYGELGQEDPALQDLASNEAAIDDLNLGFRRNPQDTKVYYTRGLAYLHLGQYLRSTVFFDQALHLDPQDPLNYLARGIAFTRMARYQQAQDHLDQAIRLTPQDPKAYFSRAQLLLNLEQYQRAIDDLDQAVLLNPFYADAYVLRGDVYQAADQPLRAQADYAVAQRFNTLVADKNRLREVILSGPQDAKDYNIRGLAYVGIGQHQLAIQDFDQSITLTPGDADGYINRGLAQSGLGAYQRAIQDFDQSIKLSRGNFYTRAPEFFPYFFNRGLAHFNLGNFEQAIEDLTSAMQFDHPDRAEAFIIRGISYGELGQDDLALQDLAPNEPAIQDLNLGFRRNPQDAKVFYTRGLAYLHLGQDLLANTYFDQAPRLDPR